MDAALLQLLYNAQPAMRELGLLQAKAQGADLEALLAPCRAVVPFMGLSAQTTPILKQLEAVTATSWALQQVPDQRPLPEAIGFFTHITQLSLNRGGWSTLPQTLSKLVHLERLAIERNQFQTLPDFLGDLPNLRELYASQNSITHIPASLFRLSILSLMDNRIQALPNNMGEWKNLKLLYLVNNKLRALPDCLAQLPHVETINVTFNKIKAAEVPEVLKGWIRSPKAPCLYV